MTFAADRVIGFEATALELANGSGVSHYAAQLLDALARRGDPWHYVLLSSRTPVSRMPDGVTLETRGRFPNRTLWVQLILPRILARLKPQLCHFTNSIAPLSAAYPTIVNIYDMSLFLYASMQPRKSRWLVRSILPAVAAKAAAIVTVSQNSKRDIVRVLKVRPEKVHVVYAAAASDFRVIENTDRLERVRKQYALKTPFLLFVGTIEPRKNLVRLVNAFAELQRRGRPEQLILVGQLGWQFRGLLAHIENLGLRDSVRLLGYVPPEDLPAIYNLARAVAFPSLYEGFGMPIIEAMSCGIPVLTSNRASMAEVGVEAALLVDPEITEEIAGSLFRLLTDESMREGLRVAGLARAADFSWQRAAQETVAVYESVLRQNHATHCSLISAGRD